MIFFFDFETYCDPPPPFVRALTHESFRFPTKHYVALWLVAVSKFDSPYRNHLRKLNRREYPLHHRGGRHHIHAIVHMEARREQVVAAANLENQRDGSGKSRHHQEFPGPHSPTHSTPHSGVLRIERRHFCKRQYCRHRCTFNHNR